MADAFASHSSGLESPATRLLEVTPNDGADLSVTSRALNVAGSGNVRVRTAAGDEGTIFVAAGVPFGIRVVRIFATGTDATGIVVLA